MVTTSVVGLETGPGLGLEPPGLGFYGQDQHESNTKTALNIVCPLQKRYMYYLPIQNTPFQPTEYCNAIDKVGIPVQ